jgi:hypothetical protein
MIKRMTIQLFGKGKISAQDSYPLSTASYFIHNPGDGTANHAAHPTDIDRALNYKNQLRIIRFKGTCLDSGAQRSFVAAIQAEAYARSYRTKNVPDNGRIRFKFGDSVHISIGILPFNLIIPKGVISLNIEVVDADVPLLIGLEFLNRHRLVINNVENMLEKRSTFSKGTVDWTIPLFVVTDNFFSRRPLPCLPLIHGASSTAKTFCSSFG